MESGQSSAVADFNLLDTARKVELYGIQMHSAKVVHLRCSEFNCVTARSNRKTIKHNIRNVLKTLEKMAVSEALPLEAVSPTSHSQLYS